MRKLTFIVLGLTAVTWTSCADKAAGPGSADTLQTNSTNSAMARTQPAARGWPPTRAQPKLTTMKLYVGAEIITAELAVTEVQVGTGMMFRTSMAESDGMLFVFARPHRTSFYMRNTTVPLTAAYIDPEGTI